MEAFHFTKQPLWLMFAAEHLRAAATTAAAAAAREITQFSSTNYKDQITLKMSLVELFALKLNKLVKKDSSLDI